MHLDVLQAAVRLIGRGDRSRFSGKRRCICCRARLTRRAHRPCWAGLRWLIRVSWLPRLTGLAFGSSLSGLPRCAWLTLRFGECGIHVPVYVARLVIVVTAIV